MYQLCYLKRCKEYINDWRLELSILPENKYENWWINLFIDGQIRSVLKLYTVRKQNRVNTVFVLSLSTATSWLRVIGR